MEKNNDSRRSFLKQILAGSVAAASSSLVSRRADARETQVEIRPHEVLYRETDDFKKYYDSLR